MKSRWSVVLLASIGLAGWLYAGEKAGITGGQLSLGGVVDGSPDVVLPASGALVHVQLHDLLGALEGVEEVVVAGLPERLLPPEVGEVLAQEHPLLTVLGMETVQEPLSPEVIRGAVGLDARGGVGLTLYLGDPRRMFILSLPAPEGSRGALAGWMNGLLQSAEVEETTVGDIPALRIVTPNLKGVGELYVVASGDHVYVCGDRSLVVSLKDIPEAQRFGQDSFLKRALADVGGRQLRVVVNPASVKPFAMQLQAMRGLAGFVIGQQRQQVLAGLPEEAREQLEIQVCSQLGVESVEQFAEYVECMLLATLEQGIDFVTREAVSFEGLSIGVGLKGEYRELELRVYSQKYQGGSAVAPIPMDELREALRWLGPEVRCFSISGRQPEAAGSPVLSNWVQRVRQKCEQRGLQPAVLARLEELLKSQATVPTVESEVPWSLSLMAPLSPLPTFEGVNLLQEWAVDLELPVWREVRIVPGVDEGFLADLYRREAEVQNRNRELEFEFANSIQKQRPWILKENRLVELGEDAGVSGWSRESVWTTRSGLFGVDQHEFINRRMVWAKQVGPYLVYHRGVRSSEWLRELEAGRAGATSPAVVRLLDRVPEGAYSVGVHRVLAGLPDMVDWLGTLESWGHERVEAYLNEAQAIVDGSADLEEAKRELRRLRMPLMVGSVAIRADDHRVYALLPTGDMAMPLPRPRLVPLLKELLADYSERAESLGGCLVTSRLVDGSWEWSMSQRWDAVTTLTRSFGNALAREYLSSDEGQLELGRRLGHSRDGDRAVFDEVVARNPQWNFIPQPRPKTDASPGRAIPERDPAAGEGLLDLSGHYNGALDETWQAGGLANNHLGHLPRGLQVFGGVSFDVRGVVQLSGMQAEQGLRVRFPKAVEGIEVNRRADRLYFLHACAWPSPVGTQVGMYVIHYANGQQQQVPINYGKDVLDWWLNEGTDEFAVDVAWKGANSASPGGPELGIFKTTWNNPRPEQEIESIDYRSAMTDSAPFLLGITAE